VTVVLYDRATQQVLAQVTFTPSDPGTLVGGSRFKPLAQPLTLLPGFKGVIAAYGFGAADPAGDAALNPPAWTTNGDVGRLTFNNGVFATTAGAFPAATNASKYANPYAAGTFLFREPAWKQTADTPTTYTVTIDNSGYSVQENKDFGALPPSYISGTVTGYPLQNGQVAPNTQPLAGWTVNLLGDVPAAQIDAGGNGVAGYSADTITDGTPVTTNVPIDTSQVFNPAPLAVYQSGRAATNGAFTYKITGLTPGVAYAVRLHFAEIVYVAPGQRKFNVAINGTPVLTDFDIFAAAGAANTAIVRSFNSVADPNGTITITFTSINGMGAALVNGVEILRPDQVVATTTSDADGNYQFNQPTPGQYTVREAPPVDWRQVAPFFSDPSFSGYEINGTPVPAFNSGPVLVTGDFNGDGYADLVVVPPVADRKLITVYYNTSFEPDSPPFQFDLNSQRAVAPIVAAVPCDLNGDGRMDIAVLLQNNTVGAFINTGNTAPGQRFQFVPDYWTLPASVSNDILTGLTAADLNHDGRDDLLLGAYDHSETSAAVLVLLNNAQPAARTVTSYNLPKVVLPDRGNSVKAGPIAVGDLNGDGNLDVIENGGPTSVNEGDFSVAFGDGKGGLSPWTTYELGIPGNSNNGGPLSLGDIKGDGSQSAVFLSPSKGSVDLALNRGNGVFDVVHLLDLTMDAFKLIPAGYHLRDVQLKDVNGDLNPDLVFPLSPPDGTNPGPNYVLVYLNTGTYPYFNVNDPRLFQIPYYIAPSPVLNIAITDLNNDGLNDILAATTDNLSGGGFLMRNTSPRKQPGIPVFLQAGAITGGNDFLNVQTPAASAVYGQVYDDENRNGLQDTRETGAAGSFVFVDLNRNGRYDDGEPAAVTRGDGLFSIPNLPDGTYSVGVVPEDGWKPTTADFVEVTVDSHTAAQTDFGRAQRLLGTVADQQVQPGAPLALPVPLAPGTPGENLVYSLEGGAPAGAAIDPTTGSFTWTPTPATPPGSYAITVRVRDSSQPLRTETTTFLVHVEPAPPVPPPPPPPPPSGPFAVPVLDGVFPHRRRPRRPRSQLLGTTLIFNVPVNLDPRALRLVRHLAGKRRQDLSRWIQVVTVVHNGQTWAHLRFRSPRGGLLLPLGKYSLVLQNALLRNALTGASLAAPGGGGLTELPL
jgi:hypothetical protein